MTKVNTIDDIVKGLLEPFDLDSLEVRVGATTGDKTRGMALAYVTNRAIQERLDSVAGAFNWQNEFKTGPNGGTICGISILNPETGAWVTKWDGADNSKQDAVKGGLSGAMKRAGSQWGIGRYLYRLDSPWVPIKQAGNSYKIVDELAAKKKIVSSDKFEQPEDTQKACESQPVVTKAATKAATKATQAVKGRPFAAATLKANMAKAAASEANVNGKATLDGVLSLAKEITGKDGGQAILTKIFGGTEFSQGQLQAVHNWLNAGKSDAVMKGIIITEGRKLFGK